MLLTKMMKKIRGGQAPVIDLEAGVQANAMTVREAAIKKWDLDLPDALVHSLAGMPGEEVREILEELRKARRAGIALEFVNLAEDTTDETMMAPHDAACNSPECRVRARRTAAAASRGVEGGIVPDIPSDPADAIPAGIPAGPRATIYLDSATANILLEDTENLLDEIEQHLERIGAALEIIVPHEYGVALPRAVDEAVANVMTPTIDFDRQIPPLPCCGSTSILGAHEHDCPQLERSRVAFEAALMDEGPMPSQADINGAMNAGVGDNPELVGSIVMYQTDGRGGKRYALPAIVTCVQKTHVDLPKLVAARQVEKVIDPKNDMGYDGFAVKNTTGYFVDGNPLPIPLDGTVHLNVLTPGDQLIYVEHSVPFDPKGGDRSWRFHPDHIPF